ncbi:MAG: hypothetical protein ABSE84_09835, partial [Isosphaeraceae bacterium]
VDWVKARGNGCICLRCGETHTFVLPMPVDDFVKATRGFIACHSFCVDRPSPAAAVVPGLMVSALSERKELED